jgi:hypothetical protein
MAGSSVIRQSKTMRGPRGRFSQLAPFILQYEENPGIEHGQREDRETNVMNAPYLPPPDGLK